MGLKTIVMSLINDQTVHYLRDTNYGRNEPHNAANMWHKICDFICLLYISRSSDCNAKYVIKIYTDIYNLKIAFKELPDNGNIIYYHRYAVHSIDTAGEYLCPHISITRQQHR